MAVQTQLVRKQHTVPRWHLKNFADGNGEIWRYKQGRPVKPSRPKGECWETDFYEYELNGRKTDNKYETWLGRVENDAAAKLQILLNHEQLGQRDSTVWATYVASLFIRTAKYRAQQSATMVKRFGEQIQSPEYIRELQYELLKKGDLVFAEDLRLDVEQLRSNMENSPSFYHVSGPKRHTVSLANALLKKSWHIVEAPPGKFFLTSDCPVTTVEIVDGRGNPGAGFGKEHTAIMFPVTPQHLFLAASAGSQCISLASPKHVDSTNLLTIRFAHTSVYSHVNSAEIKALVDSEINQIVFGQNAFLPASQN
jgi:hypothetical protein